MQNSMKDALSDFWKFFNRKEVPAMHVGYLLGKPKGSPAFGALKVTPFDRRFSLIVSQTDGRNPNILRAVTFHCPDNMVDLTEFMELFGEFEAVYEEKANTTKLVFRNFSEEDTVEAFATVIEGYKMENHPEGLLLHRPGGSTIVVPFSELKFPMFVFGFKEMLRPEDKKNRNPIFR